MVDFITITGIAAAAVLASPLGRLMALRLKPATPFMSLALGFASGMLLATICFEITRNRKKEVL